MGRVFDDIIALKPANVDVVAASEQSAGDAYIEGFEHAIVAAAAILARDDANIEAMRESLRLYRETYGPLPDDMVSTERRQDREIAALRLALQAANQEPQP